MLRRLFPFFAFLSLILFAFFLTLWLRFGQSQVLSYNTAAGVTYEVSSRKSGLGDGVHFERSSMDTPLENTGWDWASEALGPRSRRPTSFYGYPPRWSVLGFKFCKGYEVMLPGPSGLERYRAEFIVLPYWAPAILTGILPFVWFLSTVIRRRRLAEGLCPECGHMLPGMGACGCCGFVPPVR